MWFDRSARFDYVDQPRRLALAVPNKFVANWIGRHFRDEINNAARQELGDDIEFQLEVNPDAFLTTAEPIAAAKPDPTGPISIKWGGRPAVSDADVPARPVGVPSAPTTAGSPRRASLRHRLEDFIVGPSNELAYAAAQSILNDDDAPTSPLVLHGGCGLGKTHLLQGICRRLTQRHPGTKVMYQSGEQFTNEFLAAVRTNKLDQFRRKTRKLDLLAIDDVHFLANKPATQREFLHCFDAVEMGGARVLLACDSHPKQVPQFSEALISRCVRGMVVQVHHPDADTRVRIIRALARRRRMDVSDEIAQALAERCSGAVRDIEGMLTKLHALASLSRSQRGLGTETGDAGAPGGTPIGFSLVDRLFASDFGTRNQQPAGIDSILTAAIEHTGADRTQVLGTSRHRDAVLARSITAYLARKMTRMSYPEVAAAMGRRGHSTIVTAAQRVEKQLTENPELILSNSNEVIRLRDLIDRVKRTAAQG